MRDKQSASDSTMTIHIRQPPAIPPRKPHGPGSRPVVWVGQPPSSLESWGKRYDRPIVAASGKRCWEPQNHDDDFDRSRTKQKLRKKQLKFLLRLAEVVYSAMSGRVDKDVVELRRLRQEGKRILKELEGLKTPLDKVDDCLEKGRKCPIVEFTDSDLKSDFDACPPRCHPYVTVPGPDLKAIASHISPAEVPFSRTVSHQSPVGPVPEGMRRQNRYDYASFVAQQRSPGFGQAKKRESMQRKAQNKSFGTPGWKLEQPEQTGSGSPSLLKRPHNDDGTDQSPASSSSSASVKKVRFEGNIDSRSQDITDQSPESSSSSASTKKVPSEGGIDSTSSQDIAHVDTTDVDSNGNISAEEMQPVLTATEKLEGAIDNTSSQDITDIDSNECISVKEMQPVLAAKDSSQDITDVDRNEYLPKQKKKSKEKFFKSTRPARIVTRPPVAPSDKSSETTKRSGCASTAVAAAGKDNGFRKKLLLKLARLQADKERPPAVSNKSSETAWQHRDNSSETAKKCGAASTAVATENETCHGTQRLIIRKSPPSAQTGTKRPIAACDKTEAAEHQGAADTAVTAAAGNGGAAGQNKKRHIRHRHSPLR
ncbi:hypothetical protein B0H63DRAFT_520652 [Podospora didyma]|uniref:EF-hand domain-containing protein n=1 Tax=Podospora didyma TaxID=330526 RepID=A0AAE0NRW6_9PEZI|nr:hypothetical protein B0H63DRAFT_520652 [Podospora didyma]